MVYLCIYVIDKLLISFTSLLQQKRTNRVYKLWHSTVYSSPSLSLSLPPLALFPFPLLHLPALSIVCISFEIALAMSHISENKY